MFRVILSVFLLRVLKRKQNVHLTSGFHSRFTAVKADNIADVHSRQTFAVYNSWVLRKRTARHDQLSVSLCMASRYARH